MRSLQLTQVEFTESKKGSRFIPLGEELRNEVQKKSLIDKIFRKKKPKPAGIWGTLGKWTNDKELGWSGNLVFSRGGNEESTGLIFDEIQDIYDGNELLKYKERPVKEYFINLSDVQFPEVTGEFDADKLPEARLTLFLEPDEGAIVCYHHFETSWENPQNAELEYILTEPTAGHRTENRDRLTYHFPILPKGIFVQGSEPGKIRIDESKASSFVIKALVFRRNPEQKTSHDLVKKGIEFIRERKGIERTKLYLYNKADKKFEVCKNPNIEITSNVKTLLLFHGTFSSTDGTYGGLNDVLKGQVDPWFLKKLSEGYQQIIGFDHSTIMEWPEENLAKFRNLMGDVNFVKSKLDLITFSRGGLVGKQFICDPKNANFPVRKAVMVSCANGVGYFDKAKHIGTLLRYLKVEQAMSTTAMGAIISLFAQHSAKYFLSLPGPTIMNKDSKPLKDLLKMTPAPHNSDIQMVAFSGRWTTAVAKGNFLKFMGHGAAFVLTAPILGVPNDFVVNQNRQEIMPEGYDLSPVQFETTHTQFFKSEKTASDIREKLDKFLL